MAGLSITVQSVWPWHIVPGPFSMLPLGLLKNCTKNPILVEVKSGETFNGMLVNCDSFMNMNLVDVICTSANGDKFWKMNECHIKGITVKYIRIPDEVLDKAREQNKRQRIQYAENRREREREQRGSSSTRGGRGGSRGGRGGGRGGYSQGRNRDRND